MNPIDTARMLTEQVAHATLCTLSASGSPYCSLTAMSWFQAQPMIHASALARHRRNFDQNAEVSLLLMTPDNWQMSDPMVGSRLSLAGTIRQLPGSETMAARENFLQRHPQAVTYVDLPDFDYFVVDVADAYLVAGFGQIHTIAPTDLNPA